MCNDKAESLKRDSRGLKDGWHLLDGRIIHKQVDEVDHINDRKSRKTDKIVKRKKK